jgi:hypothetical protein
MKRDLTNLIRLKQRHLQPSDADIQNYIFTTKIHGLPEQTANKTEHVGFKPLIKYVNTSHPLHR